MVTLMFVTSQTRQKYIKHLPHPLPTSMVVANRFETRNILVTNSKVLFLRLFDLHHKIDISENSVLDVSLDLSASDCG